MQRMRLKKAGQLDEEPTAKFEELFQEESFLDKLSSGKLLPAKREKSTPAKGTNSLGQPLVPGMLNVGRLPEKFDPASESFDEKLFKKVQRRPVKEKGPGYYAAQTAVAGWFAMWFAVIAKASGVGM